MRRRTIWMAAVCLLTACVLGACSGGSGSGGSPAQGNPGSEAGGTTDPQKADGQGQDGGQPDGENGQAGVSGSAGGDAAAETVELTLWTYPVGNWGSQSSVSALLSGFHREYPQYHVTVKCLDYTTGDAEIEEAIESGQLPDLVLEGPERLVANWGSRGEMADLSDLWESEQAGQIYPEVRAACHDANGVYYEFPVCMTTHCMAINREMFEAADAMQYIDEETHTWTTENFVKAVEALYASGQERVAVVYCGGQGGDQGTRALVTNLYSGTFTNEEHTAYTVNSEENARALTLLQDLDGIEFAPDLVGGDEVNLFGSGELAMAFCWNVSMEIQQIINNQDMSFDAFPMAFPTDSGDPSLQGGIWGFGIFDNGDEARIEAAKEFIRYMTEDGTEYKRAVQTSTYWPVRDVEGIYANDELMTEYGMFMKYMGDFYQVTPGWADVRTAWWNMLQKVGEGMDAAEALGGFDEAAKKAVADSAD